MKNKKLKLFIKNMFVFAVFMVSVLILCGCGQTTENINVDGIEISKKNLYMAEGQTAVISAQVYPFNASNQSYTFESNNESVVTIEDGFITAKKAGEAVIYVYSEDGGYKDSCNVLVTKASENLALNEYNNLNMPPKELEPIYNEEDYETSKTVKRQNGYTATNQNSKKISERDAKNRNGTSNQTSKYRTRMQQNGKKQIDFKRKDASNNKKLGFKDIIKNTTQKVNAEVTDDLDAGKKVLDEIKVGLQNSITEMENEKEMIVQNLSSYPKNNITNLFNTIQCDMIDLFKTTKQEILDDMLKTEEKIESGEYSVESKNLNGVTFVVIKNTEPENDNAI